MSPASLAVAMGGARGCAALGTASTTQTSCHNLYWTVSNGTSHYTNLPVMMVNVNANKATVNVPDAVTCSLGGSSVPIMVSVSAIPFADIKVSVIKDETKDAKGVVTDNSKGITPGTTAATIKLGTLEGVLGFTCNATVAGKVVKYKLDGTDKAQFALSAASATVTAVKAGTKPSAPKLTIAVGAKSTASKTTVTGLCPALGEAWISLQPAADSSAVLTKKESVTAAYGKFDATATGLHAKTQWCNQAITKADKPASCDFQTASKAKYLAAVYCSTIEGWFFGSASHTNVTAKDNGGKQIQLTMTYKKKIDDVTDNAVVLTIC